MSISKSVVSNQSSLHENLDVTVKRHLRAEFQKPYQEHNLSAFSKLQQKIEPERKSLVLDSCCGTGMSTRHLADVNPDSLVIGIDQSSHRLGKFAGDQPQNCHLLQANCEDIWRLCVDNNIQFDEHYILYPNPYPKSVHLKRRWHGHPVFPYLKPLAKKTVLRSNWKLYLEEFAVAWEILTGKTFSVKEVDATVPMTLFEKKYSASGQALFEIVVES